MADQEVPIACKRTRSKIIHKDAVSLTFHMVLRSHVKNECKSIATLPEEIIFDTLLLLPAHILYAVMRYVCRQWHMIIHDPRFVTTHTLRSPTAVLFQFPSFLIRILHLRGRHIELSDFTLQLPGYVLATCNGLALVRDKRYKPTPWLHIVNPVTKRIMTLPTAPLNMYLCSMAFVASSNTYKVVVVTKVRMGEFLKFGCAILTVCVDREWRFLNCEEIDKVLFLPRPVTHAGFLYWASDIYPCMLVLNVESESFKTIAIPEGHTSDEDRDYFIPKGNSLSYIHIYGDLTIKEWVLKDPITQDWAKSPDFRVEVIRREVEKVTSLVKTRTYRFPSMYLRPISWLKNEEKVVFHTIVGTRNYFIYDAKTGDTFTFLMAKYHDKYHDLFPHESSLTWL